MLSRVLSFATSEVDNPDLNDRAYMYMCLLTECPERAPDIVLSDSNPPVLNLDLDILEPRLVATLVPLIGTLSVVYGKFPQEFVPSIRNRPIQKPVPRQAPAVPECQTPLPLVYDTPPPEIEASPPPIPEEEEEVHEPPTVPVEDLAVPEVKGRFLELGAGERFFEITATNTRQSTWRVGQVIVGSNAFGISIAADPVDDLLEPGQLGVFTVPVIMDEAIDPGVRTPTVPITIGNDPPIPVIYDSGTLLRFLLLDIEDVNQSEFMDLNQAIEGDLAPSLSVNAPAITSMDAAKALLQRHRFVFLPVDESLGFFGAKSVHGELFCVFLTFRESPELDIIVKSANVDFAHAISGLLEAVLVEGMA
jgi:hypothetical protein